MASLVGLAAFGVLVLAVLIGSLIMKARAHGDPAATSTPTTTSTLRYSPATSNQWR
jgi:hypothetical protein